MFKMSSCRFDCCADSGALRDLADKNVSVSEVILPAAASERGLRRRNDRVLKEVHRRQT